MPTRGPALRKSVSSNLQDSCQIRSIRHSPHYLPPLPMFDFGKLVPNFCEGWCMFPRIWDGDIILSEPIKPLTIPKGAEAWPGGFDRWRHLNREVVICRFDCRFMVKRLQAAERIDQTILMTENARAYPSRPLFSYMKDGSVHELTLLGIVRFVVPRRDPGRLPPDEFAEWKRLSARKDYAMVPSWTGCAAGKVVAE